MRILDLPDKYTNTCPRLQASAWRTWRPLLTARASRPRRLPRCITCAAGAGLCWSGKSLCDGRFERVRSSGQGVGVGAEKLSLDEWVTPKVCRLCA